MVETVNNNGFFNPIYNEWKEELEIVGDITLNLEYWDCACAENYIHPISENHCEKCGAFEEDWPNSREIEVEEYFHRIPPQ